MADGDLEFYRKISPCMTVLCVFLIEGWNFRSFLLLRRFLTEFSSACKEFPRGSIQVPTEVHFFTNWTTKQFLSNLLSDWAFFLAIFRLFFATVPFDVKWTALSQSECVIYLFYPHQAFEIICRLIFWSNQYVNFESVKGGNTLIARSACRLLRAYQGVSNRDKS